MKKKFVPKIGLMFQVENPNPMDPTCMRKVREEIVDKIIKFADIAKENSNAVIPYLNLYNTEQDYLKCVDEDIDVHLAELMAKVDPKLKLPPVVTAAPVAAAKPVKKPAKVVEKEEEEETPRVKAVDVAEYKAEKEADEAATKPKNPVEQILEKIFVNLKRTGKSVNILTVLANAGKELSIEELVEETKLEKTEISSWFATTGKTIPAIVKPGRGLYKLDPDKV